MGVKMSTASTYALIAEIFGGEEHPVVKKAKMLSDSLNYELTFGLFQFMVKKNSGTTWTKALPVLYSKIPSAAAPQKALAASAISEVIESAFLDMATGTGPVQEPPEPIPAAPTAVKPKTTKFQVPAPAKELQAVEAAKEGNESLLVSGVIALEAAQAIGQKVKGTSASAIYRCCAIADGKSPVRVACKATTTTLAIRVAPAKGLTSTQVKTLVDLGFTNQGTYYSAHVTLSKVPSQRVLGAMLFSMGIPFKHIATTVEQLNVQA